MTSCPYCEMVAIQGVACHETRCPQAWKGTTRECRWCGSEFRPDHKGQGFCCNDCWASYNGYQTDEDRQTAHDDTASSQGDDE